MDDNTVAAFGSKVTYFYNIEDSPNEKKKLEFDQQIQSVFENEDYVGYIINNSANPEKGKYILQVYNKKVPES